MTRIRSFQMNDAAGMVPAVRISTATASANMLSNITKQTAEFDEKLEKVSITGRRGQSVHWFRAG
jgi:hypothetical protein